MSSMQPVTVNAQADGNFVRILRYYRQLKTIKQIQLICVLLLAMIPFTWGLGLVALFLTILLCLATMVYLVVSQENVISELQRALYNICLKSVTEQVEVDQNEDWMKYFNIHLRTYFDYSVSA